MNNIEVIQRMGSKTSDIPARIKNRLPAEIVLQRVHAFQDQFPNDMETLIACFNYVVRVSGWDKDEFIDILRSLA